jgi:hypothetical protein
MSILKTVILISYFTLTVSLAGELYKYKGDNEQWFFSDKKPDVDREFEKVKYKVNKKEVPKPKVYTKNIEGGYALVFHNPYYAPVEVALTSSIFGDSVHKETVSANTRKALYESANKIPRYRYKWTLDDPKAKEDGYLYRFPASSNELHLITQSFNGRHTHSKKPNIYAVDIAMPMGAYISAARVRNGNLCQR